jgi:hypothetical protein
MTIKLGLYKLGYHHRDAQEHNVWRNRERRKEDNFQKNQSVKELVSYRDQGLNNYKKSLSLPVLDDINSENHHGETETKSKKFGKQNDMQKCV